MNSPNDKAGHYIQSILAVFVAIQEIDIEWNEPGVAMLQILDESAHELLEIIEGDDIE